MSVRGKPKVATVLYVHTSRGVVEVTVTELLRHPFYGDPAELPQPRKINGGDFAPLKSSRYHKEGYAERFEAAKRIQHHKRR